MSKRYNCKSKFHFCYHILSVYENLRRKNFINPSCLKHSEIINWNKKWHNFYFHTFLWCLRKVSSFWGTKKKYENKKLMSFSPLIPLGQQGLRLRFAKLPTYAISVSLTIEIHKNNRTSSKLLTNKTIK